jgi:hypothetical protein
MICVLSPVSYLKTQSAYMMKNTDGKRALALELSFLIIIS